MKQSFDELDLVIPKRDADGAEGRAVRLSAFPRPVLATRRHSLTEVCGEIWGTAIQGNKGERKEDEESFATKGYISSRQYYAALGVRTPFAWFLGSLSRSKTRFVCKIC